MDRAERTAFIIAGTLMVLFFGALIYSATGLGLSLPTCVTTRAPFKHGEVIDKGNNHFEVHLVAKMWAFDPPQIQLPQGADVDLYLSALDVTHGLYIEHTNVNLMAVPGSVNAAHIRFDHEGVYDMICHEYCGVGHQNMMGRITIAKGAPVLPAPEAGHLAGTAKMGEEVFEDQGCAACHTIDGTPSVGPTVKGLFGRQVELADGTTLKADEAYIQQSIRDPNAKVAKGFQPIMPQMPLTDAQLKNLVDYLKTLS